MIEFMLLINKMMKCIAALFLLQLIQPIATSTLQMQADANAIQNFKRILQEDNSYSENHRSDAFIGFITIGLPILCAWVLLDILIFCCCLYKREQKRAYRFNIDPSVAIQYRSHFGRQTLFKGYDTCSSEEFSSSLCRIPTEKLTENPSYIINHFIPQGREEINYHLKINNCRNCIGATHTVQILKLGTLKCPTDCQQNDIYFIFMIILLPISTTLRTIFPMVFWQRYFCLTCGRTKSSFDPHPPPPSSD